MGLFGGFKAKFTRNSTSKENKPERGVVALNYRISSEFDSVTCPSNTIKPIATVQARPRLPQRSATFEYNNRVLLEKLKSKSLTNLSKNISSSKLKTDQEHGYGEPKWSNVKEPTTPVSVEDEYNKSNSIYTGANYLDTYTNKHNSVKKRNFTIPLKEEPGNYIYTGPTGSVHQYEQVTPSGDYLGSYDNETPSALIMMTQHAKENSKLKPKTILKTFNTFQNVNVNSYDHEKFKLNSMNSEKHYVPEVLYNDQEELKVNVLNHNKRNVSEDKNYVHEVFYNDQEEFVSKEKHYVPEVFYDDQEEFKVNVVNHGKSNVCEDEQSYSEDETPIDFTGFSSQAANIFFGNSAPPPIRPRKINIQKDDETEEMDC